MKSLGLQVEPVVIAGSGQIQVGKTGRLHNWATLDYTKLEERVSAMIAKDPAKFVDEYLCTWKDDRQFLVKRRYDLQPANSPVLVDFQQLIEMVQPITATGVTELNSLCVDQIAHTNMYTITRVN